MLLGTIFGILMTILWKIHECFSFADKERICNDEWIACQNFIPGPLILCFRIAVCNICILRKYEKNKSHWKKNKNINLSFQKVKLQNVKKEILKSNGSFRLMNGWPRITKKTLIVHLCHLYDEQRRRSDGGRLWWWWDGKGSRSDQILTTWSYWSKKRQSLCDLLNRDCRTKEKKFIWYLYHRQAMWEPNSKNPIVQSPSRIIWGKRRRYCWTKWSRPSTKLNKWIDAMNL